MDGKQTEKSQSKNQDDNNQQASDADTSQSAQPSAEALVDIISDLHQEKKSANSWSNFFKEKLDSFSKTLVMAGVALLFSIAAPFLMELKFSDKLSSEIQVLQAGLVDESQRNLLSQLNTFVGDTESIKNEIASGKLEQKITSNFLKTLGIETLDEGGQTPLNQRLVLLEQQFVDLQGAFENISVGQEQSTDTDTSSADSDSSKEDPVNWRLHSMLQRLSNAGGGLHSSSETSDAQLAWLKRVNYTLQSLPTTTLSGAQLNSIKSEMGLILEGRGVYEDRNTAVHEALILLDTLQDLTRSALI